MRNGPDHLVYGDNSIEEHPEKGVKNKHLLGSRPGELHDPPVKARAADNIRIHSALRGKADSRFSRQRPDVRVAVGNSGLHQNFLAYTQAVIGELYSSREMRCEVIACASGKIPAIIQSIAKPSYHGCCTSANIGG